MLNCACCLLFFNFILWVPCPVVHNCYIACTRSVGKANQKTKKRKSVSLSSLIKKERKVFPFWTAQIKKKISVVSDVLPFSRHQYCIVIVTVLYLWNTDLKKSFADKYNSIDSNTVKQTSKLNRQWYYCDSLQSVSAMQTVILMQTVEVSRRIAIQKVKVMQTMQWYRQWQLSILWQLRRHWQLSRQWWFCR